jgi:hypothetical protein
MQGLLLVHVDVIKGDEAATYEVGKTLVGPHLLE